MRVCILGAGAWGTALAIRLASHHQIYLWGRDSALLTQMQACGENKRYLPGLTLPPRVLLSSTLSSALESAELAIIATATIGLRPTLQRLQPIIKQDFPVLWACKGLEATTGAFAHQIIETFIGERDYGLLTGPSFAREIAMGLPAALSLVARRLSFAQHMASALAVPKLRIYSSDDIIGAEIGGAAKNVIAIAAGVSDGLNLGNNARAALITRGIAEITRFGVAMGAQARTFSGLSGLGDLVLTCTGELSRNRQVGLQLALGKNLQEITANLGHVSEGVNTAKQLLCRAQQLGIVMPITEAICQLLFEGIPVTQVINHLLERSSKDELA